MEKIIQGAANTRVFKIIARIHAVLLILQIHRLLKFHIKKGKISNKNRRAFDLKTDRFSIANKKGTNAIKIRKYPEGLNHEISNRLPESNVRITRKNGLCFTSSLYMNPIHNHVFSDPAASYLVTLPSCI